MTMMTASHPDDERLAALAAGDRDALDDRALREHVAGCESCSDLVAELASLRSYLAELPDLTPSRPLRLLPPAPEAASPPARLPWLRRLVAPTLAAGIGLVIVGGVGSAGLFGLAGGSASLSAEGAGGSPRASDVRLPTAQDSSGRSLPSPHSPSEGYFDSGRSPIPTRGSLVPTAASPSSDEAPGAAGGPDDKAVTPESTPISPTTWVLVLAAGIALIAIGLGLRFSLQPRAG